MASKIGTFLEKIPSCQLDVPLAIDMPTTDGRDKLSKIPGGDKLPDLSTKSQSFQLAVVELQQGNRSSIDQVDPNEVWWDGSDDPENPRNWSSMKKFGNIFLIGTFCFVVPLASSIFAAGIPELMKEFGQSSGGSLSSLVLSIYVLGTRCFT
jgi:hypothetical protein